jgi:hypothetical protein
MKKLSKLEAVLWNVAFPGFSQLLMGQYVKGILFVILEFVMNVKSNFNHAILFSFNGAIEHAEDIINYQWLMFYPCVYLFSIWDAYRTAMTTEDRYAFLPFVFAAYFVTVGLMISQKVSIFGIHPGPVFLPMLFLIPGILVGFLLKSFLKVAK